jgi:predicted DNA-binding transcriptional regulator AlpA
MATASGRPLSLPQVRKLIETWQGLYEDHEFTQRLSSRFERASPSAVVHMWETGSNETGKPLSPFELAALAERWGQIFGELPPWDDADPEVTAPASDVDPPDDALLSPRETARLSGLSLSDLKARVEAGSFPRPRRMSRRRVGWPAADVKRYARLS